MKRASGSLMRGSRSFSPDNNKVSTAGHNIRVCETQMLKTIETAAPKVSQTAARVSLASRGLAPGGTSTKFGHVMIWLRAVAQKLRMASRCLSQREVVL